MYEDKVSNKPNPRKNEEKMKEAITKAYNDLKVLWTEKAIPDCHMELMTKIFNNQNNPMKVLEDIKREFSEISKDTSQVQKILTSIQTRQNCLQKIDDLILDLTRDEKNEGKLMKIFEEKISHLRILTIHCIECIIQWKQILESMSAKPLLRVKFIENRKAYLTKIKEDYKNITNSKLNEIYTFQVGKMDVFFLNYLCGGKKISNVSKNLIKRIRLCEKMLSESEQPQQTKRVSVIDKIKSPQKSITENRQNPSPSISWKKIFIQYGKFTQYFTESMKKSEYGNSFITTIQMSKYEEYTILKSNEFHGELVLAIDKYSSNRKIILLGIQSNSDNFNQILKSFCEQMWEYDNCNQIRISLVHQKQATSFTVDGELQKRLKLVGFRWVSINHSNDIRYTTYGIKRPLNEIQKNRKNQAYPVIIEHLVSLNFKQGKTKKEQSRCFASVLDLIWTARQNWEEKFSQLCKKGEFSHELNCLNRVSNFLQKEGEKQGNNEEWEKKFTYSGLRSFEVENEEKLQKILKNGQLTTKNMKTPTILSVLNTSFKFNHITINDGKYMKFFPNKDAEIYIVQSIYPIYLLQSDEENISFFVIDVEDGFSMDQISKIFNEMGEQSSFIDEFWLPKFHKSEEYIDEKGLMSTELISTNYQNWLGSLTRKSKVRTKVIKEPFVFGMINKKFLEMLQIPFYSTLVRKEDLI